MHQNPIALIAGAGIRWFNVCVLYGSTPGTALRGHNKFIVSPMLTTVRGGRDVSLFSSRSVAVQVPYPVDRAYDYAVMDGLAGDVDVGTPGAYVEVPMGGRRVPGVVWGAAAGDVPENKVKMIVRAYDLPPMPEVHRRFIDWVARYTMAPRGAVLKMSLPVFDALDPSPPVTAYRLSEAGRAAFHAGGLPPARRRVAEILEAQFDRAFRPGVLAETAGCTPGVIRAMAEKALLVCEDVRPSAPCAAPRVSRDGPDLSPAQAQAASALCDAVDAGRFSVSLLDGVTGAGKTEVYFEAVARALKSGAQVLILLPEIALSNAFLDRFRARFGCAPCLWHSALTPAQRRDSWRGIACGQTRVVVGARSALFLPYPDLGLIIVDEEHDGAFKQEDGVRYHARDMAVVRGKLGDLPVALVSATPSLETMDNAWQGRYAHLKLPARHGTARLPQMHVVDMRKDKPGRQCFISPPLAEAVRACLDAGEQSLLFLNRRGYAPLTICRSCGHRIECPHCSAWLVEHRHGGAGRGNGNGNGEGRLHCHHCGYHMPIPEVCPSCGEADTLQACGPGIERITEEARELFPQARIEALASDLMEHPEKLRQALRRIREGETDIIVGTQIIAKGHHFPMLTCVGVVDADLGLSGGDLRAAERTWQLLHQVAGRAGREERAGHVYLQTFMPENRVIQALAAHDRDRFLEVELAEREAAWMPPYSRLVGLIVSGPDRKQAFDFALDLAKAAPQGEGVQVLGPAEAPLARLRSLYRFRLLVRADKTLNIQKALAAWLAGFKPPSKLRVQIDVDPQSFL